MHKNISILFVVFIILAILPVSGVMAQDDGPTGPGCENDASATDAFAQNQLGVFVERSSDQPCAWVWAGATVFVNQLDQDWFLLVYPPSGSEINQAILYNGSPQIMAEQFVAFYRPGFDPSHNINTDSCTFAASLVTSFDGLVITGLGITPSGFACDQDLSAQTDGTTIGCAEELTATVEWAREQLRIADNEPLFRDEEDCTFTTRGLLIPAFVPENWVATIHPWGDNAAHAGGLDDRVYVMEGNNSYQDVFATTFRYRPGFAEDDAVHDNCELWEKEFDNGQSQIPSFLVYTKAFECEHSSAEEVASNYGDTVTMRATISVANANERTGPGVNFAVLTTRQQGDELTLLGRNATGDWFLTSDIISGARGWVSNIVVGVEGDTALLRVYSATETMQEAQQVVELVCPNVSGVQATPVEGDPTACVYNSNQLSDVSVPEGWVATDWWDGSQVNSGQVPAGESVNASTITFRPAP